MIQRLARRVTLLIALAGLASDVAAVDGNRLTYLDDFCNPYYVGLAMPKLTTPQWVGEEDVEGVVTLGIDDMGAPEVYEEYLRPILHRLKQIDGRAPVSIMTISVDPAHAQLQSWLKEGLSLETHTADHPCPCLQGGDFQAAKSTYDRCVDQLGSVPNSRPVAFRFPCMDSLNTPSPRAYAEIVNCTTPAGNYLQISSSVCMLPTAEDPALPRELVIDEEGRPRAGKYLPLASFVNKVENYPYPFVIGRLCWEFPCVVPSDWQGQHLHQPNNPRTVEDYQAAIDAAVLKQGVANVVFHPSGWIRSMQMVSVIDHAVSTHGERIKFLTFPECLARINQHLLAGQPLRSERGQDNGVRLLDVNHDGYMDVVIGNERLRRTRIWSPERGVWQESDFPVQIVSVDDDNNTRDQGVRFGVFREDGMASFLVANETETGVWHFDGRQWVPDKEMSQGLQLEEEPLITARDGLDLGVRLRDVDGDGLCEILVSNSADQTALAWDREKRSWRPATPLPKDAQIVDRHGRDSGLRFVDLDEDGHDDMIFSNERRYAVHRYDPAEKGWTETLRAGGRSKGDAVPMIVRNGTNNGVWFADKHMWIQNEDTARLPDGVDRRTFSELIQNDQPRPQSPQQSLRSLRPRPGFKVELVAAEPLVMDPISFDWGADGRLWVVEMADYPLGLDGRGKPGGRVRYLEDADNDGRYEQSTLFAEGLSFPTGVMAWGRGVLVTAAPDILYLEDSDGDGREDRREVLYHGFAEGNQQHRVNGFAPGLDNWVHLANGDSGGAVVSNKTGEMVDISGRDLRIRPATGELEAQTGQTQFGRFRDDWENWFGSNNSVPLRHYMLSDHYLRRNQRLKPSSTVNEIARSDNSQVYPSSRVLSHWEGYKPPAQGQPHRFTSACGGAFYRDELFGPAFEDNIFICEPVHNLVHRRIVEPAGTTFTSRRADDERSAEFLASVDSWFRPTCVRTGPDGALWVADMYRLVIEHPEWIADSVEENLSLRAGHEAGRIYRVYPENRSPRAIPRLSPMSLTQLVAALDSPNGWQRDTAQRLLIERNDRSAIGLLSEMVRSSRRPLARLHALCTLEGLDGLDDQLLVAGLRDNYPGVRRHAVRLCEPRLTRSAVVQRELLRVIADKEPQVQLQLAYSLGAWDDERAGRALGRLALEGSGDDTLRTAVLSSLGSAKLADALQWVLSNRRDSKSHDEVLSQLLELAAETGEDQVLANALARIVKPSPDGAARAFQFATLARIDDALQRKGRRLDEIASEEINTRVRNLIDEARRIAVQPEGAVVLRLAAVQLFSRSQVHQEEDLILLAQMIGPKEPIEIQSAALAAIRRAKNPAVVSMLLEPWEQYTPQLRSMVLDVLLSRPPWIEALLSELEAGRLLASEIDPAYRERLLGMQSEVLRQRSEAIFAAAHTDRQTILDRYEAALSLPGDVQHGELLFAKHCSACHRVQGVGHDVGPDLVALRDKSPHAILAAVLDPNQAVEARYVNYLAVGVDGLAHSGILANETTNSITLRGQDGRVQAILRKDLEAFHSTGKSLMPEGLEGDLSVAEMADLLAYLTAGGSLPKEFAGNRPALVRQGEDGRVRLLATTAQIYGSTSVFEKKHQNLGYFESRNDRAIWQFTITKPGNFEVIMEYACQDLSAGNRYIVKLNDVELSGRVIGTGTWDDYRKLAIGQTRLGAGEHQLIFRPAADPSNYLIDLRSIILQPAAETVGDLAPHGDHNQQTPG